jgi:hypothetical protein
MQENSRTIKGNQATEVYPRMGDSSLEQLSQIGGACADFWANSPTSCQSPSSTCEELPYNRTSFPEPSAAYTKSVDNGILKQAFKSMVRERHNHGRKWLVLRQAELSQPERPLSRVRSFFGI